MLTVTQIAAIIMLLTAFGVDPIITADVQRILEGRPAITSTTNTTMTKPQAPLPTGGEAAPEETIQPAAAPVSKARIDVINTHPGMGLGRKFSTSAEFDEGGNQKNTMVIGAVVYDEQGEPTRTAIVTVSVRTPSAENSHSLEGTGNVIPIYPNGQKRVVPVYPLRMEFTEEGEHTITFSANGVSQSVTVTVGE